MDFQTTTHVFPFFFKHRYTYKVPRRITRLLVQCWGGGGERGGAGRANDYTRDATAGGDARHGGADGGVAEGDGGESDEESAPGGPPSVRRASPPPARTSAGSSRGRARHTCADTSCTVPTT